jgi:hypothetical protein
MTRHVHTLRHQLLLAIQASCYIVDYYDRHGEPPATSQINDAIVKMSDMGDLNPWCDEREYSSSGSPISRDDTVALIHDFSWIAVEEFEPLVRAVKDSMG